MENQGGKGRGRSSDNAESRPGIAIDSTGGSVIDPTKNVADLVQAEKERGDDLRELYEKISQQRDDYALVEIKHVRELIELQAKYSNEVVGLRAEHQNAMAMAEANRLNSIRQVDAQQVQSTATQANLAIQTLEATTRATAETLRNTVATSAATIAAQFQGTTERFEARIRALEQSSSMGAGRSAVTDPALTELIAEVRGLGRRSSQDEGRTGGLNMAGALIVGASIIITTVIAAVSYIHSEQPVYVQAPVSYSAPAAH
jgi:hypothetical protein